MCPAVYLYDNVLNNYTLVRPWQNEEQKVDKQKKRNYTRTAVLQSLMLPWKRKGKKEKRYYNTGYSYLVTHPSTNCTVEWTKHVAVLVVQ